MDAILGFLGSKLGLIGVGVAIPIIFMFGKRLIPKYFGNALAKILGQGMANIDKIIDPKRKELIHAIAIDLVKLAEYECPDKGTGKERFKKVAAQLCAMLPFLKGRDADIAVIIENAVAAMDEELKKVGSLPDNKAQGLPVPEPPKP